MADTITSLPNLLTLSRIVIVPLLIALFYVPGDAVRWISCGLFVGACFTDFLDGYLARSRSQQSKLGRFLDPVADKLLVAATILMLVAFGQISGLTVLPAVVILCREILVSGLREFLAGLQVGVPVSRLAKWKTTIQMIAISFLLVGDAGPDAIPIAGIGAVGLWVAAALTFITGYDYLRAGLHHMTAGPAKDEAEKAKDDKGDEPSRVRASASTR